MNNKEKISVIIPCFNSENTIKRCINSVLNQTYNNIEVIVVNDGSTDNTLEIINFIELNNINVKVYNKLNGGVSSARNYGLEKATGEYVIFLDADDYMKKSMCESLIKGLKNGADIVICGFDIKDRQGKIKQIIPDDSLINKTNTIQNSFEKAYFGRLLNPPWNKLYKKSKINEKFNENKSSGEDLEFTLDYISYNNKICFLKESLYVNDISNENSLSKNYSLIIKYLIINQIYINNYINKMNIKYNMSDYFLIEIGSIFTVCKDRKVKEINVLSDNIKKDEEITVYLKSLQPNSIRAKYLKYSLLSSNNYFFNSYIKILSILHKIKRK